MKVLINYLTCLQRCSIAETLRMGLRAGVKGELLLDAFMRSAADSRHLRNRGPRMISGDFTNPVSTLDVLTKDIKLGLALGQSVSANMPLGDICLPFFTEGQELGFGNASPRICDADAISGFRYRARGTGRRMPRIGRIWPARGE